MSIKDIRKGMSSSQSKIRTNKRRKIINTNRKTAIIVGVLFITATIAGILSVVFGPNLDTPDFLSNLSANENQVLIGALLEFTMAVLIAGIPIFMYPILKKYNEALALGYVVFRTIEVVFFIVCAISLLTLLTLSQEFVIAGTPDASYLKTLATLLLAVREWGEVCFQPSFLA